MECPAVVDKATWLGGDTWPDKFSVAHYGYYDGYNRYQRNITVTRIDSKDGWAMNLQFLCCPKEGMMLKFHIQFVDLKNRNNFIIRYCYVPFYFR